MMNSTLLKLIILSCLIFQMGCGLKFKRKTQQPSDNQVEMLENKKELSKDTSNEEDTPFQFSKKDSQLITLYFKDKTNVNIRHDMMMSTQVSKEQEKSLVAGKYVTREIQVMPLPLKLERMLSVISLNLLRVQVANNVILMNVKSRKILDIIKI